MLSVGHGGAIRDYYSGAAIQGAAIGVTIRGLLSELLFEGCYSGAAIGAATIFGISGIFGIPAIMPSQLSPQHQKVRTASRYIVYREVYICIGGKCKSRVKAVKCCA